MSALELVFSGDPKLFGIVSLSLFVTLSATVTACAVGLPLGALVALTRFPGRNALIVFLNGCMGLPPVVVGLLVYLLLSRSGATIIGGMLFGLSRKAATEFSFFLAVPTLIAAGLYDSWNNRHLVAVQDAGMWAVGLIVSFISAFLVIRWLIRYVATHDFRWFAWYRIAFGIIVLLTAATGAVDWTAT